MHEIKIKNVIEKEKSFDDITFYSNSKVVEINGQEIGFYTVKFSAGRLTVEYNLFSKFRNKGYGKDFLRLIIKYVEKEFSEYNFMHVLIEPSNDASIKVAKANGFGITNDNEFLDIVSQEGLYLFSRENSLYKPKKKILV